MPPRRNKNSSAYSLGVVQGAWHLLEQGGWLATMNLQSTLMPALSADCKYQRHLFYFFSGDRNSGESKQKELTPPCC